MFSQYFLVLLCFSFLSFFVLLSEVSEFYADVLVSISPGRVPVVVLIKLPNVLSDTLKSSRDAAEDAVANIKCGGITWKKACGQSGRIDPRMSERDLKRMKSGSKEPSAANCQYGIGNGEGVYVHMPSATSTTGMAVYLNQNGVRQGFQLGGSLRRAVTPYGKMMEAQPKCEEYLRFNLDTIKLLGPFIHGPPSADDDSLPADPNDLESVSDASFSMAYNWETPRLELNKAALHFDKKTFAAAAVSAKAPRERDADGKAPTLGVCDRFGPSASAGALFIEVGCSVFGYTENDLILFVGSWLHAPLSTGHGHTVAKKKRGQSRREVPVPDRASFVCFLHQEWKLKKGTKRTLRSQKNF